MSSRKSNGVRNELGATTVEYIIVFTMVVLVLLSVGNILADSSIVRGESAVDASAAGIPCAGLISGDACK